MDDNLLTDKEFEEMTELVISNIERAIAFADKHNIERDSLLKYFANLQLAMTEVSTFQNYKGEQQC